MSNGRRIKPITKEEGNLITTELANGKEIAQIARRLCRNISTIYCWLKANKIEPKLYKVKMLGARNPNWKGGRSIQDGYITILLHSDDPFYEMATAKGYVREHRYIMAKHLNRFLLPSEHIHHRDGDRANNTVENLELISPQNHIPYKQMCKDCPLRKRIKVLERQLISLIRKELS